MCNEQSELLTFARLCAFIPARSLGAPQALRLISVVPMPLPFVILCTFLWFMHGITQHDDEGLLLHEQQSEQNLVVVKPSNLKQAKQSPSLVKVTSPF